MKVNLVFNLTNNQIRPAKKMNGSFAGGATIYAATPCLENLQANFIPFALSFKGASILDKIIPPTFEDKTLNAILQRNTDNSGIDTKYAKPRSEDNTILSSWFTDVGLEEMQAGKAYREMCNEMENLLHDGVSFEERDKYYMAAVQKLVDCGAIDDKTFVLIDTGHNIPIAAQLMKEENLAALGNVKGTFSHGESTFPKTRTYIDSDANEKSKTTASSYESIRNASHCRISSQALSFSDIINDAYKNSTNAKGALFIGVDTHRYIKFDTLKLPTAAELKELGLDKVAVIQELPPLSAFLQSDVDIINPLTEQSFQRAFSYMRQACDEARMTLVGAEICEASKMRIKELLTMASKALKPRNIDRIYSQFSSPGKKQTSKLIEEGKFGYGNKMGCRSDVNKYLKQLKKDSKGEIKIFIEGAALLKLRNAPVEILREAKNNILAGCNNSFEAIIEGDFSKVEL